MRPPKPVGWPRTTRPPPRSYMHRNTHHAGHMASMVVYRVAYATLFFSLFELIQWHITLMMLSLQWLGIYPDLAIPSDQP